MFQKIDALKKVHDKGYIHCDIKTDNFLFNGRRLVLTDFGLAKKIRKGKVEVKQTFCGTPQYMSARVAYGKPAAELDDLVSVVYTAIFMRCGWLPWINQDDIKIKFNEQVMYSRPMSRFVLVFTVSY